MIRDNAERSLMRLLAVVAAAATAGLVVVFFVVNTGQKGAFAFELGKGLIQLLVVVVIGAALKLLTDRYQQQQERVEQALRAREAKEAQRQQFRQDKCDRLVEATNQLRNVPILIEANRSIKTWSVQMLEGIEAGLKLRTIKHQIYSSRVLNDVPFSNCPAVTYLLEWMYHYTDWVTEEFADRKKQLSELRLRAEETDLPDYERERRQSKVRDHIRSLRSIDDMRKDVSPEDRERYRTAIFEEFEPSVSEEEKKKIENVLTSRRV